MDAMTWLARVISRAPSDEDNRPARTKAFTWSMKATIRFVAAAAFPRSNSSPAAWSFAWSAFPLPADSPPLATRPATSPESVCITCRTATSPRTVTVSEVILTEAGPAGKVLATSCPALAPSRKGSHWASGHEMGSSLEGCGVVPKLQNPPPKPVGKSVFAKSKHSPGSSGSFPNVKKKSTSAIDLKPTPKSTVYVTGLPASTRSLLRTAVTLKLLPGVPRSAVSQRPRLGVSFGPAASSQAAASRIARPKTARRLIGDPTTPIWTPDGDLQGSLMPGERGTLPRLRFPILRPPVERHRVTLPNPLPDDSWAVDERSLKLFVDALKQPPAERAWYELRREAERIALVPGFDRLITLDANAIKELPHQIDVAQRVLRDMGGRAILADEVGLGKTIEESIIYKELAIRGLARRALILTPASLVGQWQGELEEKFFERFDTPTDPDDWQRVTKAIISHDRARARRHAEEILRHRWDLVIVDEAHKVKSHRGATYQFIERIERDFILLLTATPLQNDLRELYNLITLLRPGQLGTWDEFKAEHLVSGDHRQPRDPEALRALTHAVMIRTRPSSVTLDQDLPPRRPRHPEVKPTRAERSEERRVGKECRSRW